MYLLTKVSREKALASEEEKKVQVINADVAKKQKACQEDLAKAEPALIAAKNALGTLNKVTGLVCLGGMDYIYYKIIQKVQIKISCYCALATRPS